MNNIYSAFSKYFGNFNSLMSFSYIRAMQHAKYTLVILCRTGQEYEQIWCIWSLISFPIFKHEFFRGESPPEFCSNLQKTRKWNEWDNKSFIQWFNIIYVWTYPLSIFHLDKFFFKKFLQVCHFEILAIHHCRYSFWKLKKVELVRNDFHKVQIVMYF